MLLFYHISKAELFFFCPTQNVFKAPYCMQKTPALPRVVSRASCGLTPPSTRLCPLAGLAPSPTVSSPALAHHNLFGLAFPLGRIFWRFVQVVAVSVVPPFYSLRHFCCWVLVRGVDGPVCLTLTHWMVSGLFPVWGIINETAISICLQVSVWTLSLRFSGISGQGSSCSVVWCACFVFKKLCQTSFQSGCTSFQSH